MICIGWFGEEFWWWFLVMKVLCSNRRRFDRRLGEADKRRQQGLFFYECTTNLFSPAKRLRKMSAPSPSQLSSALTTQGLPAAHPSFLNTILTPPPNQRLAPLAALTATAKHRLLSSDLTHPSILVTTTPCFPQSLSNATIASQTLRADTPVQVLDIEDLSRSKWEQIEALEMERKGEMTKGREVIRLVEAEPDASTQATQNQNQNQNHNQAGKKSHGPFKLLLQDMSGQKVYGFELKRVEKVGYPPVMNIGCKVMLRRGCQVSRGMVLLEPAGVVVLGGKIEGLDKSWREERENTLRNTVTEGRRVGDEG
jgi:RecQ-mediated genome instability protein 1